MTEEFNLSVSPHLHKKESITWIIWMVFLALLPAGIAGIHIFGWNSLRLILISVLSAVAAEAIILFLRGRRVTVFDGSAVLTGLLLGYNLPPQVPFWLPVVGSFFAIAIAKQAFGGLGRNIFNPALTARAFLLISWPTYMTSYARPFSYPDAVTSATPLNLFKESKLNLTEMGLHYWDLFLGRHGGCIGEVAIYALLIGAIFLLALRIITLHIPLSFIFALSLFSWLFPAQGFAKGDPLFAILTGGAVLGVTVLNVDTFFLQGKPVSSSFILALAQSFFAGIGFTLALLLMSGIRERLQLNDTPRCFSGVAIAFIIASLMSLAFMGFNGFRF